MRLRLPFHRTLATRLWLAFILGVALPVAVLGTLLVLVSERALIRNASEQSLQTIAQIARGIDEDARQTALWAAALSSDKQILAAASRFAAGQTESQRAVAAQLLDRKMASFFDYTNKIGAVQILFRGRAPYVYRNSPFLFEQPVDRTGWYDVVTHNGGRTLFLQDLRSYSLGGNRRPLLSVAVSPAATGRADGSGVNVLLVSFRAASLEAFYDGSADGRELVLLSGEGRPLLSSSDGVIRPNQHAGDQARSLLEAYDPNGIRDAPGVEDSLASFRVDIRGTPYLVSTVEIPSLQWRLLSAIPYGDITRSVESFSRLARYALLLLLVIFVVYIEVSFHEVIRPLRQVVERMRDVETGNYCVAVDVRGPEEIVRLGSAFNSMVREVNRLTAEKEANQRERARLELEALRLQINPHFLSNTLNSIRLMAAVTRAESIEKMTKALMKVVTDSFGREGALERVDSEMNMLRSYVLIMKIRYGNNFVVAYDIAPETEALLMLRMLLQPIVENSILHGFQDLPRRGRIEVRTRMVEKTLRIEITDNGVGMPTDRVGVALAERVPDTLGMSRVGLSNVQRRIELNHGSDFGVSIKSTEGAGTSVTILLPVIESGERDVSRHGG